MILILPDGLKFFAFGWWVIHVVAIYLVYSYAYRRGRRDERKSGDRDTPGPAPR
jgi:hypothetical protein